MKSREPIWRYDLTGWCGCSSRVRRVTSELAGRLLVDTHRGRNVQHDLAGLLRQATYSRLGNLNSTKKPYGQFRLNMGGED